MQTGRRSPDGRRRRCGADHLQGLSPAPHRCGSSSGGCSPRPVPNWPSSPPTAMASSPTGTERPWKRPTTAATPDRERHSRPQVRRRAEPHESGRFAANGAWLAVQVMAHNLARWTARIGLGEQIATTNTLRRRFFSLAGRLTRSARRLTLHLPQRWPWETQFSRALARLRAIPLPA